MFSHLLQDLRYGTRTLLAKPGFTLAAVLTLALGIGANTAVFSVIHALLLEPLPYAQSARLVDIYNSYPRGDLPIASVSIPDYLDRRAQAPALADAALYSGRNFNLAVQGSPERLAGLATTPSLFSTLGASAALGRVLQERDATAGNEHVVVLSDTLWRNRFAGDPALVGHDVHLNGESWRVVGVMPPGFFFPSRRTQLWTPSVFTDAQLSDDERGNEFSAMLGRLAPGATIAQLDAQMDAIVQHNLERVAGTAVGKEWKRFVDSSGFSGRARSLRDARVGDLRATLWLLQALVACVLLIACANVANLMLTRLSSRYKELAVRSALGAGMLRIARQLLLESVLLALLGGIAGIVLADAGVTLIRRLGFAAMSESFTIQIDAPVLMFAFAASISAGIVFGVAPVLSLLWGRSLGGLKESGRGNSAGPASRRLRNALVVTQTALAVALLGVAGLLVRSYAAVQSQSPGFSSDHVLSATLDLPLTRYPDAASQIGFYGRLLAAVRALPAVQDAGLVSSVPFSGNDGSASYIVEGAGKGSGATPHGYVQLVDAGFFQALRIPLLQGRVFDSGDSADSPRVAIVDELLVRKYFPDGHALGKRIALDYSTTDPAKTKWLTIVGVVPAIKHDTLSEQMTKETVYIDYLQQPYQQATLAMRTAIEPAALIAPLRAALQDIDPEQPLFDIQTMDERIALSLDERRSPLLLLVLFAAIALALAAVGIYGVLAFAVAMRTGEIGVRLSLGAQRRDILRLVLGDGGRLTAAGLLLGLAGAVAIAAAIRAQLFGVGVLDLPTLGFVMAIIAATALLACWLPARRAAGIDPIQALRHE